MSEEKIISYVISVAAFVFLTLHGIVAWFVKRTITNIENNLKSVANNLSEEVEKISERFAEISDKFNAVVAEERTYGAKRAKEMYGLLDESRLRNKELEKLFENINILLKELDKKSDERFQITNRELDFLKNLNEKVITLQSEVKSIEKRVEDFGKVILK